MGSYWKVMFFLLWLQKLSQLLYKYEKTIFAWIIHFCIPHFQKKTIALTNRIEDASECTAFNTGKTGEKNLPL